jgi:hypothetical protein
VAVKIAQPKKNFRIATTILFLGMTRDLRHSSKAWERREAAMARELQFLAVGCVFVFLGAIVVGIF